MRLSKLITPRAASNDALTLHGPDVEITGITTDSRNVKPGFLFVAIPGTKEDGRTYVPEAIKLGATAILAPEGTVNPDVAVITTPDIRKAVSLIASNFYPRQPETIAAVTGTSGKTSTAQFTRELWATLGHPSASIGTLGLVTSYETRYGSLTTPDAMTLHQTLDEIAGKGITHLAMEASSHGLLFNRLDHVRVKIGGFTNLSRDHLDFHGTMEDYLTAKLRLFMHVMPEGSTAVLNADAAEYDELAKRSQSRKHKILSYGHKGKDITLKDLKPQTQGQILKMDVLGKNYEILLPVIGEFQAWNAMCALGMVIASGENADKAVAALAKISGVPGRLQLAGHTSNGGAVFIDYAHKPDALENVLKALQPHLAAHHGAKLGVVFGCGGNRDKGKRPIMGEIAQRLADWVIVTDDNPRNEEPAIIRKEILAACKAGPGLQEIGDRAQAIETGIGQLNKNDILVIAGKGHESGQIIGDQTLPFDDLEVAQKVLGI